MYSRLLIARQLLREDGLIFISIDDKELSDLIALCDEIFGKENFVGNFVWQSKKGGGSDSKTNRFEENPLRKVAKGQISAAAASRR